LRGWIGIQGLGWAAVDGWALGHSLLSQCRASAARVKGAPLRYASPSAMALRATLDTVRSSPFQKRASSPEERVARHEHPCLNCVAGRSEGCALASRQHAGPA
jgi:hypothetical protein